MTVFLRLFTDKDKANALLESCAAFRDDAEDDRLFQVSPECFRKVPGAPFAYWVSDQVRAAFDGFTTLLTYGVEGAVGAQTSNNFRFLRVWWEKIWANELDGWIPYGKGGVYSQFYGAVPLLVNSANNFNEIVAYANRAYPYLNGKARSLMHADRDNFGRIGLTWTKSTTSQPSFRFLPSAASYSDTGPTAGGSTVDEFVLKALSAIMNSRPFKFLLTLSLGLAAEGRKHYEIGIVNKNPIPLLDEEHQAVLVPLANRAWSLRRTLDTVNETSHAFLLPTALRVRLGDYDPPTIEAELTRIQDKIDEVALDLYGFSDTDRAAMTQPLAAQSGDNEQDEGEDEWETAELPDDAQSALISWAVGVAFGRFDWRLATGQRQPPPEPDPFDPLPPKSPGMLPDGAEPFHVHPGILVDDSGHPHDLAHLVEEVLARVEVAAPNAVRRWLQRDFFPFHLQRYSKSRRKAPIYWPLGTASGSYSLWVYYPSLGSQTLYTAINDFIEPKLEQVDGDLSALRGKGSARTRDDERRFESLQGFELELIELRDTLFRIAPTYRPNQDDGVQISAAPLWSLFRHKPWQKVLKDTWAKLEKGDYDWAHLALNYWPERVREKCKSDKSLAIAHGLEDLYVEPEAQQKKPRGRRKAGI